MDNCFRSTSEHLASVPQTHFSHIYVSKHRKEWRFSTRTMAVTFILLTQIPDRTLQERQVFTYLRREMKIGTVWYSLDEKLTPPDNKVNSLLNKTILPSLKYGRCEWANSPAVRWFLSVHLGSVLQVQPAVHSASTIQAVSLHPRNPRWHKQCYSHRHILYN